MGVNILKYLLFDLDDCDQLAHPHAFKASSAVVESQSFLALYTTPPAPPTPTGRARLLDGSIDQSGLADAAGGERGRRPIRDRARGRSSLFI